MLRVDWLLRLLSIRWSGLLEMLLLLNLLIPHVVLLSLLYMGLLRRAGDEGEAGVVFLPTEVFTRFVESEGGKDEGSNEKEPAEVKSGNSTGVKGGFYIARSSIENMPFMMRHGVQ